VVLQQFRIKKILAICCLILILLTWFLPIEFVVRSDSEPLPINAFSTGAQEPQEIVKSIVTKQLYLHRTGTGSSPEYFLNTLEPTSEYPNYRYFADGDYRLWKLKPVLAKDFNVVGDVLIKLYLSGSYDSEEDYFFYVEIGEYDGQDILWYSDYAYVNFTGSGWYEFIIQDVNHLFSAGNKIILGCGFFTSASTAVHVRYNSVEYDSRIELPTDTYISVDDISTHNAGSGAPTVLFSEAEPVLIHANISDPFGAYDIAAAKIIINYPDGTEAIHDWMELIAVDTTYPHAWKLYEYVYYPPEDIGGAFDIIVIGVETNDVTDDASAQFIIPAIVFPDHSIFADPATLVTYAHEVCNCAPNNVNVIDIRLEPTENWLTAIYHDVNCNGTLDASDVLMATDANGDGDFDDTDDYVDPNYDINSNTLPDTGELPPGSSMFIIIQKEVPFTYPDTEDITTIRGELAVAPMIHGYAYDYTTVEHVVDVTITPADNEIITGPGADIYFEHEITNAGNDWDLFELTTVSTHGWNLSLYHDVNNNGTFDPGLDVLMAWDANGNGNYMDVEDYVNPDYDVSGSSYGPDTSWLDMTDAFNIILHVTVPGAVAIGTVDYINLTCRSTVAPEVTAVATETIVISSILIRPEHIVYADPNSTVCFTHEIINQMEEPDIITLFMISLLFGWELRLYEDINGNEALDDGIDPLIAVDINGDGDYDDLGDWINPASDSNDDGLPDTNSIAGESSPYKVILAVSVPPGVVANIVEDIILSGTSINYGDTHDAVNKIIINQVAAIALAPNNEVITLPGTTVNYSHIITNLGNGGDAFNLRATSSVGWSIALYADLDGNQILTEEDVLIAYDPDGDGDYGDANDMLNIDYDIDLNGLPDTGYIEPMGSFMFFVQVTVPSTSPYGTVDELVLSASSIFDPYVMATATDLTRINAIPIAYIEVEIIETLVYEPVVFDGSGSYDPDDDLNGNHVIDGNEVDRLIYSWNFGDPYSNASNPNFVSGHGLQQPIHVYTKVGDYVAVLTVDDGWCTASDQVLIKVSSFTNHPPCPDAGEDREVEVCTVVWFNGSYSYDPDNDALSFYWDFGDPFATSVNPTIAEGMIVSHIFTKVGEYTVTLTVSDGFYNVSDSIIVTVISTVNHAPIAHAGNNQTVKINTVVQFDGTKSYDPDDDPLTYFWDFDFTDGISKDATGPTPTHIYKVMGKYTVTLTVTDGEFYSKDTVYITVVDNLPPVADAGANLSVPARTPVMFNASGSYDPDGDPLTFDWDFGDGTYGTGMTPTHVYEHEGNYSVTLTVSDGRLTSSDTIYVEVTRLYKIELDIVDNISAGAPGDAVVYEFTVLNLGSGPDTALLTIGGTANVDWADLKTTVVELDMDESAPIELIVTIPTDAVPGSCAVIVLSATSLGDLNVTDSVETITYVHLYKIKLESSKTELSVARGTTAKCTLTLSNLGTNLEQIKLTIDGKLSSYAMITRQESDNVAIESIQVEPGSSTKLTFKISLDRHAPLGKHKLTVTAVTINNKTSDSVNIWIIVQAERGLAGLLKGELNLFWLILLLILLILIFTIVLLTIRRRIREKMRRRPRPEKAVRKVEEEVIEAELEYVPTIGKRPIKPPQPPQPPQPPPVRYGKMYAEPERVFPSEDMTRYGYRARDTPKRRISTAPTVPSKAIEPTVKAEFPTPTTTPIAPKLPPRKEETRGEERIEKIELEEITEPATEKRIIRGKSEEVSIKLEEL
jgi:PKD repeat protein